MWEGHIYICITHAFSHFSKHISKPCVKDCVCQTFTYYKTNNYDNYENVHNKESFIVHSQHLIPFHTNHMKDGDTHGLGKPFVTKFSMNKCLQIQCISIIVGMMF